MSLTTERGPTGSIVRHDCLQALLSRGIVCVQIEIGHSAPGSFERDRASGSPITKACLPTIP